MQLIWQALVALSSPILLVRVTVSFDVLFFSLAQFDFQLCTGISKGGWSMTPVNFILSNLVSPLEICAFHKHLSARCENI